MHEGTFCAEFSRRSSNLPAPTIVDVDCLGSQRCRRLGHLPKTSERFCRDVQATYLKPSPRRIREPGAEPTETSSGLSASTVALNAHRASAAISTFGVQNRSTDRSLHFTHQTGLSVHRATSRTSRNLLDEACASGLHVKVLVPYMTNLADEMDVDGFLTPPSRLEPAPRTHARNRSTELDSEA